ncbi:ABC-type transport auxiliary lipoprotein family protein [Comamonas aquatilis]|uniref:ABC-type transport auxiliary lipoprotein family protein n=1 Tax=Comamonas aquatilis TaxID=1778406 RepID=UPI0039EE1B83
MALQNTSIFGRRMLGAFGAAGLVLALAACSGLPTAPIQPVRYDLGLADLGAQQPASAAAPATALTPLVLAEVQTPGLPDGTTAMFYRLNYADSQQLRAYQNARWGLSPAQMMEQRLRMRLGQERPILTEKDNVSATVSDKRTIGVLRVEIDEFSQVFDSAQTSQAVVRLRASLIGRTSGGAGNALLGQKVFTAQTPAASNDAAGGAQAMARSVDDVTAQVSRWLQGYGR